MYRLFHESASWKKATIQAKAVYRVFKDCGDYGYYNQITRAAVSVTNNIAEGHERQSQKELRQFLYIAKGSNGELRSMIILAKEIGYINDQELKYLYNLNIEVSKLLGGFITKINVK